MTVSKRGHWKLEERPLEAAARVLGGSSERNWKGWAGHSEATHRQQERPPEAGGEGAGSCEGLGGRLAPSRPPRPSDLSLQLPLGFPTAWPLVEAFDKALPLLFQPLTATPYSTFKEISFEWGSGDEWGSLL